MVAERDFGVMNQVELRKVAKELGVRQKGVSVAKLKAACKCAAVAVGKAIAERALDDMNQAELRKAAKELGVRQKSVSVAKLKAECKRAAERDCDVMKQVELRKVAKELGVQKCGVSVIELKDASKCNAERAWDAMNQTELRKVAKELGVRQCGVSVIELKDACKRAVWEARQQITLIAWMAGNAHVAESAAAPVASQLTLTAWLAGNACVAESVAAPFDSNPEDSGAVAVPGTPRQALPAARWQEQATPLVKAKRRLEQNGGRNVLSWCRNTDKCRDISEAMGSCALA